MFTPTFSLLEPSLPLFSTREARFRKARDANTLLFSIPSHSSLLLPLLRPVCRAYRQEDAQCLHLLQTVALVPSCQWNKVLAIVMQALQMPLSPQTKSRLETSLRPLITKLQEQQTEEDQDCSARPLVALQLKEAVADSLRCWIADPIEGFVLRKEHVVNGMRLDDLVTTPAGAGYLRGYRPEDGFCTIVYPWGHGFVQVKQMKKAQPVVGKHLKKRTYNEYVALEHQQLDEQIEKVLENLPSPAFEDRNLTKKESRAAADQDKGKGDIKDYKKLLKSLEEEHVDTTVLRKDLGFFYRVQALANKAKEAHRIHMPQESEQKLLRTDEVYDLSFQSGQERLGMPLQDPVHMEEQLEQEQDDQSRSWQRRKREQPSDKKMEIEVGKT